MGRLSENGVISIKNKSFSVTAEIVVPDGGANGVIIAQGGRFGGWSLFLHEGRATFTYNVLGIQQFTITAERPSQVARTRCAWSSRTTAAGSRRAAT